VRAKTLYSVCTQPASEVGEFTVQTRGVFRWNTLTWAVSLTRRLAVLILGCERNNRMTNQTVALSTMALVLFTGCSDSAEVGQVQLRMEAASATHEAQLTMADSSTEFVLESATLNVRHVELDLPDGTSCADVVGDGSCEDEDKIVREGPFLIDLLTGESTPSLGSVPAGTYARIDFRVDDSDALDDRSFVTTAAFELDGEPMALALALKFNEDIRIEQPDGVSVEADDDLFVSYVTADWLAGIDIAECVRDDELAVVDGVVTVDDDATSGGCSDIENTIKENMKRSGQLNGE